jgi:hypothetical protein
MSESSIRKAGMTSQGVQQCRTTGTGGRGLIKTPLNNPALQQQRAELRRATGTVEHHSANARAMATSSPEPPVAE